MTFAISHVRYGPWLCENVSLHEILAVLILGCAGDWMMRFIGGMDRSQSTLFPECLPIAHSAAADVGSGSSGRQRFAVCLPAARRFSMAIARIATQQRPLTAKQAAMPQSAWFTIA